MIRTPNFFLPGKKEEFQGELGDKQLQFGFSLGEGKDATEITRLKPGSPAYKSGMIHEGDQILALQWENDEEVDVSDGSTEEVNAFISGDHGKSLTLTLKKIGWHNPQSYPAKGEIRSG